MEDNSNLKSFKLVILGGKEVGKTCIINRFIKNEYSAEYKPTAAAMSRTKLFTFDKETIKFEIWDTESGVQSLPEAVKFHEEASVAVVVYSVSDKDSFHKAKDLIGGMKDRVADGLLIALVGNKSDVDVSDRQVTLEDGFRFAMEHSLLFLETSAATGDRVKELFAEIAWMLLVEPTLPKTSPAPPVKRSSSTGSQQGHDDEHHHHHHTRPRGHSLLNEISRASHSFLHSISFMMTEAVYRDEMEEETPTPPGEEDDDEQGISLKEQKKKEEPHHFSLFHHEGKKSEEEKKSDKDDLQHHHIESKTSHK